MTKKAVEKMNRGSKANDAAEVAAIQRRLKEAKAKQNRSKQFTSWSFSRYSDYKQCPLKAKLKHLDKVEEPPSDAMQRGADIGRLAELYVKGSLKKLPLELAKFKNTFAEMRALYKKAPQRMVVEDSWAMRKDWSKTRWDDWEGCVVRVKVDCGNLVSKIKMVVRDWKTGKFRPETVEAYVEQLELYALAALQLNHEVEEVECYLCFLDAGVMYPEPGSDEAGRLTFDRADLPRLKKTWDRRTRAMLLDRSFAPRPNNRCGWCWYKKDNAANMPGGKALCRY